MDLSVDLGTIFQAAGAAALGGLGWMVRRHYAAEDRRAQERETAHVARNASVDAALTHLTTTVQTLAQELRDWRAESRATTALIAADVAAAKSDLEANRDAHATLHQRLDSSAARVVRLEALEEARGAERRRRSTTSSAKGGQ